jgi:uncharacterized protein (TIGR03435 family)
MKWLAAFAGILALAQAPEFDAVSIKLAPQQQPGHTDTRMSVTTAPSKGPGKLNYYNVNLKDLIGQAYRVKQFQIEGPGLAAVPDRYDISAVVPAGYGNDQVPLMLQALLADRFKLMLRRETRQLPVYALIAGKNGPKLKPVESGGGVSTDSNRSRVHLDAKVTLERLADLLSDRLDRPVLDQTGLKGTFDIVLDWSPDSAGQDTTSPSIFTAVQEQLGLKLEPKKEPVEFLVVDHAERPSEN